MTDLQTTTGPVTIDDVRSALGDTDPNQTNASKVRTILGRGSFETIQKHLATLRAELAAAAMPPVAVGDVPSMPTDAAQAMWVAAWTAAQVQTMARAEKLAAERDAALLKLEAQDQDVAGLVATVDEQAGQLDQATAAAAAVEALHQDELAKLDAARLLTLEKWEADQQALERTRILFDQAKIDAAAELAKVQVEAMHAAELAEQGRAMMREELARLTDQVGELKANLYKRAQTSPDSPAA